MSNWGYKPYVPASVKKARAARSVEKLKKKNALLAPVQISGRKMARTWWGMAWNENLERYADYANRIERGRSYVRQGAVLDLQVEPGKVLGLVQGSRLTPYKVTVTIQPLKQTTWQAAVDACAGSIHSMQDLINGKFPQKLADLFTAKGSGLFPAPREIDLHCNCPDWADMCKHVAAVLYGIGARFDEDPTLFFLLRQVSIDDLISDALDQASDSLLARTGHKSRRSLEQDNLGELFGVTLDEPAADRMAAASLPEPAAVCPARKRGRPKKQQPSASLDKSADEKPPQKKRGRPKKQPS